MLIVPINSNQDEQHRAFLSSLPLLESKAKALWRTEFLARRSALTAMQRQWEAQTLVQTLLPWLHAQLGTHATLGLYSPFRDEIDVAPLRNAWCAAGGRVVLPVVENKNAPLVFAPYTGRLRQGCFGIMEPDTAGLSLSVTGVLASEIDALILPCVGYSPLGFRLGYGGGYYDRTLAAWREQGERLPVLVGLAHAWAIAQFAPDIYDEAMDVLCLLAEDSTT